MTSRTLIVERPKLSDEALEFIIAVFSEEFPEEPFAFVRDFWPANSVHALVYEGEELAAHAGYLERDLYVRDRTITSAYVEFVCAEPRRRGYGSEAMEAIRGEMERRGFELGALCTGTPEFYERLGWRLWRGPTAYRATDGAVVPTPEEKPMVLDLGASVDLEDPIECDWRAGDIW